MSSTALSTPIIRTRVHLAHTIKDGWRVDELTAEVTQDTSCGANVENLLHELLASAKRAGDAQLAAMTRTPDQVIDLESPF